MLNSQEFEYCHFLEDERDSNANVGNRIKSRFE